MAKANSDDAVQIAPLERSDLGYHYLPKHMMEIIPDRKNEFFHFRILALVMPEYFDRNNSYWRKNIIDAIKDGSTREQY